MSSFSTCSSDDCDLESQFSEQSIYTVSSTEMNSRSSSPDVISCSSCVTTVPLDLDDDCDLESQLSEHSVYDVSSTEMNSRSSSPEVGPNYKLAYQVERQHNSLLSQTKTALESTVAGLERDLQLERARYALLVPQQEEESKCNY